VSTPLSSQTTVRNTDRHDKPRESQPEAAGDSRVEPADAPSGR
jgi:hypothetical protein